MTTPNPQDVGGLPELPEPAAFMKRPSAQNSHNREEPYFTASQMRAYGELCRAAPAGGDDLAERLWEALSPDDCPKLTRRKLKAALKAANSGDSAPAGGETWAEKCKRGYFDAPDSAPAESGEVSYRWLDDLRYRMDHCISAADEGEDYAVPREYLDAMTTLGLMKKVGRGKWAPTEEGEAFAQRKPTLPVNIYGKTYEVPIPVQLHIVALEEAAALLRKLQQGAHTGKVVAHRLHTPGGKWQWIDGEPSLGTLDLWKSYGWTLEYAYAASQGQEGV